MAETNAHIPIAASTAGLSVCAFTPPDGNAIARMKMPILYIEGRPVEVTEEHIARGAPG
jgi:hypothetical protein